MVLTWGPRADPENCRSCISRAVTWRQPIGSRPGLVDRGKNVVVSAA